MKHNGGDDLICPFAPARVISSGMRVTPSQIASDTYLSARSKPNHDLLLVRSWKRRPEHEPKLSLRR